MTIAEYIKQDLRARIQGGKPLPEKLTLTSLSEHYHVSMTPVRTAVRELIDEHVLTKRANGRLVVNQKSSGGRQTDAPKPPTDWEQVIAADVIQMSLRGESDYLREEATARHYGIGRTVIRQIFSRLAGKGLLEHIPRCGWKVREYDEEDVRQYIEAREALELKALDMARPNLVREDLERMLEGNLAAPNEKARLDNDLHGYLIEKSGNPYIRDFFDRHGLYYTTLFNHAAPGAHVVAEMAQQHRDVLEPLIAKKWSEARAALSNHIRSQLPVVQKLMAELGREAKRKGHKDADSEA